ncbi:SDR family oxidoreductase [Mycolicibacterium cosmeticum]|uniref:SDR family oxidoreductase n=1 Tax=Mycolicibacterium cosmeticum TaxID=258533 RepID=UPI00320482FB
MTGARGVLVTGAAGHVGADTVARLVRSGHHVVALVHRRAEIVANNGRAVRPARTVYGDVRAPGFGLDAGTRRELAGEIDVIVHGAAVTDFGLPEHRYTELNVQGTAHAVACAREWGADLLYVSTAYVCGEYDGTFTEDQLDVGQRFGNDYERSKFQAEQLVRACGLRWAIVRPGIVSGEYRTGHSREHKHIYQVLKLIVEGKLQTLPGNYAATLGLSPIGHVADTIAAVAGQVGSHAGHTFHAVGAAPVSLRTMSDILAEYPSFRVADFVPPATFDPDDLDDIERGYYDKVGRLYTSYLSRRVCFDSTTTRDRLGICAPHAGAGYFRRILDSCLRTGYLGRPQPSIAEVLATWQTESSPA